MAQFRCEVFQIRIESGRFCNLESNQKIYEMLILLLMMSFISYVFVRFTIIQWKPCTYILLYSNNFKICLMTKIWVFYGKPSCA